jgi:hypothetical protein
MTVRQTESHTGSGAVPHFVAIDRLTHSSAAPLQLHELIELHASHLGNTHQGIITVNTSRRRRSDAFIGSGGKDVLTSICNLTSHDDLAQLQRSRQKLMCLRRSSSCIRRYLQFRHVDALLT